jgi:hypothetical protein
VPPIKREPGSRFVTARPKPGTGHQDPSASILATPSMFGPNEDEKDSEMLEK